MRPLKRGSDRFSAGGVEVMDYKRSQRVGDQIRMEIADILMRKVKDPRVGFITVTSVQLTDDLRNAKVFISVMGDNDKNTFQGLEKARSFIRGELGRRLKLRFVPELNFVEDHSAEAAARINNLLKGINEANS